jgi:DNA-binding MarR family transcriptional regulator
MTQPVRTKYGICWEEEYILGLVDHAENVTVSKVLELAKEAMTQATTHKYLTQLIDKRMLEHIVGDDRRIKVLGLTRAGIRYLDELSNVSVSVS